MEFNQIKDFGPKQISHECPSTKNLEWCQFCNYIFLSEADKQRHQRLNHLKKPKNPVGLQVHACKYQGCTKVFPTRYLLWKHKNLVNHIQAQGRRRSAKK